MKLTPDILFDRLQLKQRLKRWQVISAILAIIALIAIAAAGSSTSEEEAVVGEVNKSYIARIRIEGMILDDSYRDKVIAKLKKDKFAKAVIFQIDSPGGTTAGGEELYSQLRELSASGKPVVVVMRTLAASGGYMVALGGDRIYARNGTITGSIGVLMQSAEFTELAAKIGVKFDTIKSAELKAVPSPFEELTPKARESVQELINDFYKYFVTLVAERRNMDMTKAYQLADGRVYTGTQAVKNGLIDEIGGEPEALKWLQENKKISTDIEVKEVSIIEPEKGLADMLFGNSREANMLSALTTQGLLALYKP